ncbi:Retrovirus-related Pol polyprotein from transposon 297 [Eumeta japonica]|uniref:Retrovirus-related Pol polyprotein from transposon 297 n=1 Tax=Eumeta variegata TaxID=151549 RepID=A0A4C1TD70_EUMVA|nr:Retrovirus-related Pol polyprotein from transposon 297 [Eumeta japonica]
MLLILPSVPSQNGHPIVSSRTLNEHELNYSATEKELLAIVWATKYFRPYLYGRRFLINSDHKPLQWLQNLKEPNQKLQRWKIKLNEFDFEIKHIPGRENHVADALSRARKENCNFNEEIEKNGSEPADEVDGAEDVSSVAATIHSADEDNSSHRRGLENVVGDGLKFLFGTLNKDDKMELESRFDDLKANIITTNEFNELIDHVNNESRLLQELESDVSYGNTIPPTKPPRATTQY